MPKTDSSMNTVGCKTENNAKKVNPIQQWNQIDWKKAEKRVFKLQKRIYKASRRDDVLTVRRLQKTLIKSWTAKCLAVRRVTQENTGKKTAGVDGVKSLSPVARMKLVNKLKLSSKVSPTRRVWIDKPGKDEKRPLGIPTMYDRALQALVKLALEPEWEARFEPNSYGFRPGRSCHDAIGAIFSAINKKAKYVLDADIAKCFDRINHDALLKKLNTFPTIRRQIRAWLKAGVMDNKRLFPTSEGTPQGGVISPLLANIALHGMENAIKELAETLNTRCPQGKTLGKRDKRKSVNFVRYADDFVILHEDLDFIKRCREFIADWLKGMGLELKPSKTRLAHTLEEHLKEKPGFDFLGFNVRQYPTGKYTSSRVKGKLLGFKTIIIPTKDSQKKHYKKVAEIIDKHKGQSQANLIRNLNPIIRGWCNYFSTVVSQKVFKRIWHLTVWKLIKWGIKRHRNKGKKWVYLKYFQTIGGDSWTFATSPEGKNPMRLLKHSETKITRYVKVKDDASPYNGDTIYWSTRMGKHPEMLKRTASLLKKQNGKCPHCGLSFKDGDLIELDHIIPKSKGGKNEYSNYQLLHRHCHDEKTRTDGSLHRDLISQIKLPRKYKWVQDMLVTC